MTRHSPLDRMLHRLALQNRALRKFCFARECERNGGRFERHREHVFIAGMARSGSTALLNTLHASDTFASTRYALMPFVLAPSLACVVGRLARAPASPVERRHGDSLQVGPQSPEALDGLFWNTFLPSNDDPQQPRDVPGPVLEYYAMFIENTLAHYGKTRYLSKMNQGIALLPDLARWFDRALFLVPFREPLQQAASLLRQHRRFARLGAYESTYLEWLGHHEFGATHRAFVAHADAARSTSAPTHLDYWLEQWRNGYAFLAQLVATEANVIALGYERMAASDDAWQRLARRLGVELNPASFVDCNDESLDAADADPALLEDCRVLYRQLLAPGEEKTC